jgi:hypothetical protein
MEKKSMNKKPGEYCGRPNGSDGSVYLCPGILQKVAGGVICSICQTYTEQETEYKPYDYRGKKVEVGKLDYTGVLLEFTTTFEELYAGKVGVIPAAIIMLSDGRLKVVRNLSSIKIVN